MDCCIGVGILVVLVVGGSVLYGVIAGKIANQKRIEWARTLNNASLPELERKRQELEGQVNTLQKERLLVSGHKRSSLDVELGECNQRIVIIDAFIKEQKSQ